MIESFKNEYRWLSNFAPCEITYKGNNFSTVEHAYMGAKSNDKEWIKFCSDSNNPAHKLKRRSRNLKLVENWDEIKVEVMGEILRLKFVQEPYRGFLLDTGDIHIQEGNTWRDTFWGVDLETGEGENNLGKLIMEVREELRKNRK